MRDQAVWSLFICRWRGVEIRIHMFFFLFAAFTLYLTNLAAIAHPKLDAEWLGVVSLIVLFASVLAHELSHVLAANVFGGRANVVILGPLGGLVAPRMPRSPWGELWVLIAGPAANIVLCSAASIVLAWRHGETNLQQLLEPFVAIGTELPDRMDVALQVLFMVNYFLLVVNLIPAYPFDGGRALRAMLVASIPTLRPDHTVRLVAAVAKLFSLGLLFAAWLQRSAEPVAGVPIWFGLLLLSIFILFSARREEIALLDRSPGETVSEEDSGVLSDQGSVLIGVRRHIDAWRQKRKVQQRALELARDELDEVKLDEVLARLHDCGIDRLSAEEKNVLRRASERYRNRSGPGSE